MHGSKGQGSRSKRPSPLHNSAALRQRTSLRFQEVPRKKSFFVLGNEKKSLGRNCDCWGECYSALLNLICSLLCLLNVWFHFCFHSKFLGPTVQPACGWLHSRPILRSFIFPICATWGPSISCTLQVAIDKTKVSPSGWLRGDIIVDKQPTCECVSERVS